MGETIRYTTPDGQSVSGYLARSSSGRGHAVVVIQEWWGLNDQIRGVADRFAAAGYDALAPDLYRGRVTEDPDEASHIMDGLDWVGATEQDLRGAVSYLKQGGGKVAVAGFCMGGALVLLSAARVPEVDAGICFYGIPPAEAADLRRISIPLLGHFATRDDWCTPEAVAQLEKTLKEAGVELELHRYDAQHGFFNEQIADIHDAAAAEKAWERTLAFLAKHL